MKKLQFKSIKVLAISTILGLVFSLFAPMVFNKSSQAVVGLDVVWDGVSDGDPIFTVNNMAPGDSENKTVTVNNGASIARLISVKGTRTGGVGTDPKIETVLDIVISESGTDLYGGTTGAKTVEDFFADSAADNGIMLSILSGNDSTSYDFTVTFPDTSGNEFQAKSVIFDITIGVVVSESIVINEVYYEVDSEHGFDSPGDRGVGAGNISAIIAGNGAGSVNTIVIDIDNKCKIVQVNNSSITNNVNIGINTGGNSASGNTGGNVDINSGSASANVNISNNVNQNNSAACKFKVQNHEWIELFNPTDQEISLKNWTITDNSGISRTIPGNRKLKPGQFALISRDNSTWRFWNEDPDALKIPLGKQIGDGLDNAGDHLILSNSQNNVIDTLSYGDDTSIFDPPIPLVSLGASFERLVPGFDNDVAGDFEERNPPTPGN